MANRSNSKKIFDQVESKTNVSEKQLKSIASQVNAKDLRDEKKIRQLIAQVGAVAGVPVSKEKEDQIVRYLLKHNLNPGHLHSMIQMFMNNKNQ